MDPNSYYEAQPSGLGTKVGLGVGATPTSSSLMTYAKSFYKRFTEATTIGDRYPGSLGDIQYDQSYGASLPVVVKFPVGYTAQDRYRWYESNNFFNISGAATGNWKQITSDAYKALGWSQDIGGKWNKASFGKTEIPVIDALTKQIATTEPVESAIIPGLQVQASQPETIKQGDSVTWGASLAKGDTDQWPAESWIKQDLPKLFGVSGPESSMGRRYMSGNLTLQIPSNIDLSQFISLTGPQPVDRRNDIVLPWGVIATKGNANDTSLWGTRTPEKFGITKTINKGTPEEQLIYEDVLGDIGEPLLQQWQDADVTYQTTSPFGILDAQQRLDAERAARLSGRSVTDEIADRQRADYLGKVGGSFLPTGDIQAYMLDEKVKDYLRTLPQFKDRSIDEMDFQLTYAGDKTLPLTNVTVTFPKEGGVGAVLDEETLKKVNIALGEALRTGFPTAKEAQDKVIADKGYTVKTFADGSEALVDKDGVVITDSKTDGVWDLPEALAPADPMSAAEAAAAPATTGIFKTTVGGQTGGLGSIPLGQNLAAPGVPMPGSLQQQALSRVSMPDYMRALPAAMPGGGIPLMRGLYETPLGLSRSAYDLATQMGTFDPQTIPGGTGAQAFQQYLSRQPDWRGDLQRGLAGIETVKQKIISGISPNQLSPREFAIYESYIGGTKDDPYAGAQRELDLRQQLTQMLPMPLRSSARSNLQNIYNQALATRPTTVGGMPQTFMYGGAGSPFRGMPPMQVSGSTPSVQSVSATAPINMNSLAPPPITNTMVASTPATGTPAGSPMGSADANLNNRTESVIIKERGLQEPFGYNRVELMTPQEADNYYMNLLDKGLLSVTEKQRILSTGRYPNTAQLNEELMKYGMSYKDWMDPNRQLKEALAQNEERRKKAEAEAKAKADEIKANAKAQADAIIAYENIYGKGSYALNKIGDPGGAPPFVPGSQGAPKQTTADWGDKNPWDNFLIKPQPFPSNMEIFGR